MRLIKSLLLSLYLFPYSLLGQNSAISELRSTSFYIENKNDTVTQKNLNNTELGWIETLNFQSTRPKKYPKLNNFTMVSPFDKLNGLMQKKDEWFFEYPSLLNSFLFKSNKLISTAHHGSVYSLNYSNAINNFGYDYYLKKGEVTNEEYREFVKYVKDSIFLTLLADDDPSKFFLDDRTDNLNWKYKIDKLLEDPEYKSIYDDYMYKIQDENQFYQQRKIDSRKLNYKYTNKEGKEIVINIYPDTLTWFKDYPIGFMSPLNDMYYWHPTYDSYPVVGLSYHQVKAYIHWLNKKGIKDLDKKGIEYEIALPKPEEIEFAVTTFIAEDFDKDRSYKNLEYIKYLKDKSFAFDLKLYDRFHQNYFEEKNSIVKEHLIPFSNYNSFTDEDHIIFTSSINYVNEIIPQIHTIAGGFNHLGSNISEWLDADYKDYKDFISLKINTLKLSLYPEVVQLGNEMELRFMETKDNYPLIMGANWLDQRYSIRYGAPLEGIYAKTYANPDSAYSTVGFRYVIRIKNDVKPTESKTTKMATLNVFDELKELGFTLQTDTTKLPLQTIKTLSFYHSEKHNEIKQELVKKELIEKEQEQEQEQKLKKSEENVVKGNYLSGIYELAHISNFEDKKNPNVLQNNFPTLISFIEGGNKYYTLFTSIPNQPNNILIKYKIEFENEYTIKLTRLP